MSDEEKSADNGSDREEGMSIDDDAIPPSPPATRTLKVSMFERGRKRKMSTTLSEDNAKRKKSEETVPKRKRTRKVVTCTECGIPQQNIWRHMKKQHNQAYRAKNPQKLVTEKGYVTYICPANKVKAHRQKCEKVVKRLGDHLVRSHRIKSGSKRYKNLMSKAQPVLREESSSEMDDDESDVQTSNDEQIDDDIATEQMASSDEQMASSDVQNASSDEQIASSDEESHSDEESCQDEQHNPVAEIQTDADLFINHPTIRSFVAHLQTNGTDKKDAMMCGAEAYHVWRCLDRTKSISSLLNKILLEKWVESAINSGKVYHLITKYLHSVIKLLQFLILRDYVVNVDVVMAKDAINSLHMSITMLTSPDENESLSKNNEVHLETSPKKVTCENSCIYADDIVERTPKKHIKESDGTKVWHNEDEKNNDVHLETSPEKVTCKNSCIYVEDIVERTPKKHIKESDVTKVWHNEDEMTTVENTDPDDDELCKEMTVAFNRTNTWEDPVAKEMCKWLQGFPYQAVRKTAIQHTEQAFVMWHYISPDLTMDGLLNKTALNEWVSTYMNVHAPGTIISYLGSLTRLLDFLDETAKFKRCCAESVQQLREHIKNIRRSLKRKKKTRMAVIESNDIQNMVTPEDIEKFLASDIAKHCQDIARRQPEHATSSKDFYDVRDYLLFRLLQTNAQRPQAIRSITEETVKKATIDEEGWATLTISEHKTAYTQGAANIAISPDIYLMINNFINMCQRIPHFRPDSQRSIFTTWPQNVKNNAVVPLNSSQVNAAINKIWAQGHVQKTISATKLRKATTTHVREANPESRMSLARHMKHAPATADKYYHVFDGHKKAAAVGKLIRQVMEKGSLQIQTSIHWPKETEKTQGGQSQEECDETTQNKNEPLETEEKRNDSTLNQDIVTESKEKKDDSGKEENTGRHRRRLFDTCESSELIQLCQHNIDEGNHTKSAISASLMSSNEGSERLEELRENTIHWPKETEKTQSGQSQEECDETIQDKNEPSDTEEERNDSTLNQEIVTESKGKKDRSGKEESTEKHRRRFFDTCESSKIIQLCQHNIDEGNITKSAISATLMSSNEGKELLEELKEKNNQLGWTVILKKIVDRVRTEARKEKKN